MAEQETLRQHDQKILQSQADDDAESVLQKIAREAYVIGVAPITGAAKDGYKSIMEHPGETGLAVAGTFAIGLGLGYFSRGAGIGGLVARGAGAAFGVQFAREVASPQRWSVVRDTIADTWSNRQNFERNVRTMENSMGRFVFDTTLMLGAGVAGAKVGGGLRARIGLSGTYPLDLKLAAAETALPMSARMPQIEAGKLLGERRVGVMASEATPLDVAGRAVKPENSLGGIAEGQLNTAQYASALEAMEPSARAREINNEWNRHFWEDIDPAKRKLHQLMEEEAAVGKLAGDNNAVRKAWDELEALEIRRLGLPGKEARLELLEEQMRARRKAPVNLTEQARELREKITRTRADLNESDPNSAINRASASLMEAKSVRDSKLREAHRQAWDELEALEIRRLELPHKEARLELLEELIRDQQNAKGDLTERTRELRKEVASTRADVNESDPNSAINRAQARLTELEPGSREQWVRDYDARMKLHEELDALEIRRLQLPQKEARLKLLEELIRDQQNARGDLTEQAGALRKEVTSTRADLNESNPNAAINRASVRLTELETLRDQWFALDRNITELKTLHGQRMVRLTEMNRLRARIEDIQAALEGKKAADKDLGAQLRDALKDYARLAKYPDGVWSS